jgi:hypothetical protein
MEVTAKQKQLFKKLKQKIKQLQGKEAQSRAKMQAALSKVDKIGQTYKVSLARKMREMKHKLAHTQVACYLKIASDLENQLVKGIKQKIKALNVVAKRAKQPAAKRTSHKRARKKATTGRRGQKRCTA